MSGIQCEINIDSFVNVYYFEFGKDFSHTPEKHPFWEMVYVDKGKVVAITNGTGCVLNQGQAIFHEPGEIHAHISNKEVANNMLVVSFTSFGGSMDFFKKKTFTLDKTSKTLLTLFMQEAKNALGKLPNDYNDKALLDFSEGKFGASQLMQCHFTEFLIKLIRSGDRQSDRFPQNSESRSIAKDSTVEMIIEHLECHVRGTLTLGDICERFFIGKSQLTVIFRAYTGKSPMEYYGDLKISEAKKLLREDDYSISEITDILCYSSIHTFSRAFKTATGFSPTAYKKSVL